MSRTMGLGLIVLSLSVLGAGRPARADVPYFGWGFQCTNCRQELSDKGIRMEFTSPPEIIGIDADGPAERAGLKVGDVILSIDEEPLTKKAGADRLFTSRPGKTLRIGFRRGALGQETSIRVGSVPDDKSPGSLLGRSEAHPGHSTLLGQAGDAPVRFSGSLDEFKIEVRGNPDVHVVMPLDESWMDIISKDMHVKIRRTAKK